MKRKRTASTVYLVASGDLRLAANLACWPAQQDMEARLGRALKRAGWSVQRAHRADRLKGHGFIDSQRMGMDVFSEIPEDAPVIVALSAWQYSHHVLAGLTTHRGPILTVANWSGQWPGLVGLLNLNGSLTKAGVTYSSLWSQDFTDDFFSKGLRQWLTRGTVKHNTSHVTELEAVPMMRATRLLGEKLASELKQRKAILGVFDEGCMGMFNAIIPDQALHACGVFKERLSQSALYHETMQTSEDEGEEVYRWLLKAGMTFNTGRDHATKLTREQIRLQCRMYIAALRIADDFGCDAIGIQYQQGLKDLLPASDLVEGMLNNSHRPPVRSRDGSRFLWKGQPLVHFNEVDECAGLDGLMTQRVHEALGQPVENTLHDVRWGANYKGRFVWTFLISGAVPPAHFENGWKDAQGHRQPAMYFPNGGSTICGISKPGPIVWSRIFVKDEALHMDLGLGESVALPPAETQKRCAATTPQWPIMHATLNGVTRDQFMARHQANHIQVAYATTEAKARKCLLTKAAMARSMGMQVHICGVVGEE